MAKRKKHIVDLKHAAKYDGETLSDDEGWKKFKGECAAGVQYVFSKGGKPIGKTATWKEGSKVKGSKSAGGTAIASFRDGKYKGAFSLSRLNHASITRQAAGGRQAVCLMENLQYICC